MLNFDEELAKYEPCPLTEGVEELIKKEPLTDLTDIMKEMLDKSREEKEV